MKTCNKCKETKELAEFSVCRRNKDGLQYQCKPCKNRLFKEYREDNKEKEAERWSQYYKENRIDLIEHQKQYAKANRPKITARNKKRRHEDPVVRMVHNMRCYMRCVLKGTRKHESTLELLGCSPEYFRDHMSAQFTEGMTHENYGEWHMDHIQPVSSFDQKDPEQRKICWHYTNYQPLWAEDNQRKSDQIVSEFQVNLL